jgi:hypothetical protein
MSSSSTHEDGYNDVTNASHEPHKPPQVIVALSSVQKTFDAFVEYGFPTVFEVDLTIPSSLGGTR